MLNDWLIDGFTRESDLDELNGNLEEFPYCQLLHFMRVHHEHASPGSFTREALERSGLYMDHPSDLIHWEPSEQKVLQEDMKPIDIQVSVQNQMDYMLAEVDMNMGLKPFSKWLRGLDSHDIAMSHSEHSVVEQGAFSMAQDAKMKKSKKKKKKSKSSKKNGNKGKKWSSMTDEDFELNEEVCSETLAGILAHQGHYKKAKAMYKALILKNPEKSAYFARKLKKLKKKE